MAEIIRYHSLDEIDFDHTLVFSERGVILGFAQRINTFLEVMNGSKDWSLLNGLSVLDLGCGSAYTPRTLSFEGWRPYFCQLCAANGARVVGVDLYPPDEIDASVYTHIQADLVKIVSSSGLQNFSPLKKTKFDIIHSNFLIGSGGRDLNRSLKEHNLSEDEFEKRLKDQAKKMLNNRGVLYLEDEIIKK